MWPCVSYRIRGQILYKYFNCLVHPSLWSGLGTSQEIAFVEASTAWRTLVPEAKAIAKKDAAAHNRATRNRKMANMISAAQAPTDVASLWGMGKGSKFPLHPEDVAKLQHTTGEIARLAAAWTERASTMCQESQSFPSAVAYRRILQSSLVGLDTAGLDAVNEIMSGLKLLFGKRGTEIDKHTMKFAMNLVLVKHSSGPGMFIQPCAVSKSPSFDVKLMTFRGQQCGNVIAQWTFEEGSARTLEPTYLQLDEGIHFLFQWQVAASKNGGSS